MHPSIDEIKRALQLLFRGGDTVELRAFDGSKTLNGYYQQLDRLAADALQLNSELQPPAQCYVVLNPVSPALHSRRADEVGYCGKGEGTGDPQVVCRRWLVIDCDPVKAAKGSSATDTERQAAEQLAGQVYRYLEQCGWPAPAVATSGNGYWLLFRLADFPNDSNSRWALRQLLVHLAERFDSQAAVVDRTTFSAAQLVKLLGTVARKGSSTAERPHRLSQLLAVPEPIQAVTWEQLTAITGQPPVAEQRATAAASDNGSTWDIAQLLADRGLQYQEDADYITASGEQATRYELDVCPFDAAHDDRSAYLIQWQSGAVCFGCHHNGCAVRDWQALKRLWTLPDSDAVTQAVLSSLQQRQAVLPQQELLIVRSTDVQIEPIEWLWFERFAIGGVNLCVGRGGIGKTFFLCDLVARITNDSLAAPNGDPLLHGRVLYSTGEDHIAKVIEPRMQQHGVHRDRLEYIKGLKAGRYVQLLDVVTHADLIRQALERRPDTIAVVLDPITSFQGGADSNKLAAVRQFTAILTQLAEEFGIAVLGVHHFNKGKRDYAGDSISGSHAYRDAPRSIWLYALDANDPERRLMISDKHNWAQQRPPGLAYRIVDGRIAYEAEPLMMTSDELFAQETNKPIDIACAWLLAKLSSGPQPAIDIQAAAALENITDRTLQRAKERLGVVSRKGANQWIWYLPSQLEETKAATNP